VTQRIGQETQPPLAAAAPEVVLVQEDEEGGDLPGPVERRRGVGQRGQVRLHHLVAHGIGRAIGISPLEVVYPEHVVLARPHDGPLERRLEPLVGGIDQVVPGLERDAGDPLHQGIDLGLGIVLLRQQRELERQPDVPGVAPPGPAAVDGLVRQVQEPAIDLGDLRLPRGGDQRGACHPPGEPLLRTGPEPQRERPQADLPQGLIVGDEHVGEQHPSRDVGHHRDRGGRLALAVEAERAGEGAAEQGVVLVDRIHGHQAPRRGRGHTVQRLPQLEGGGAAALRLAGREVGDVDLGHPDSGSTQLGQPFPQGGLESHRRNRVPPHRKRRGERDTGTGPAGTARADRGDEGDTELGSPRQPVHPEPSAGEQDAAPAQRLEHRHHQIGPAAAQAVVRADLKAGGVHGEQEPATAIERLAPGADPSFGSDSCEAGDRVGQVPRPAQQHPGQPQGVPRHLDPPAGPGIKADGRGKAHGGNGGQRVHDRLLLGGESPGGQPEDQRRLRQATVTTPQERQGTSSKAPSMPRAV
jgi:hypothetical protein